MDGSSSGSLGRRVFTATVAVVCITAPLVTSWYLIYRPGWLIRMEMGSRPVQTAPGHEPVPAGFTSTAEPLALTGSAQPATQSRPVTALTTSIDPSASESRIARNDFRLVIQKAGGSEAAVERVLTEARLLGYNTEVGRPGRTLDRSVVRHFPGYAAPARLVASELWPEAVLEERNDISVEVVLAIGKS